LFPIIEVESVYCAVRPESLYNTDTFRPQRVKAYDVGQDMAAHLLLTSYLN
jgi:hypothetical protein